MTSEILSFPEWRVRHWRKFSWVWAEVANKNEKRRAKTDKETGNFIFACWWLKLDESFLIYSVLVAWRVFQLEDLKSSSEYEIKSKRQEGKPNLATVGFLSEHVICFSIASHFLASPPRTLTILFSFSIFFLSHLGWFLWPVWSTYNFFF